MMIESMTTLPMMETRTDGVWKCISGLPGAVIMLSMYLSRWG
jgi:hypothetical protein